MTFERLAALSLLTIALLLTIDVGDDVLHGADLQHVLFEGIAALICLGLLLWRQLTQERHWRTTAASLGEKIRELEAERDLWRARSKELLLGLSTAIDQQFEAWGLSTAEKEVGFLILKGLSHKEIGSLRGITERTVRQQAASIYAKSGIDGKAGLLAFFLEDLLLPQKS